MDASTLQRAMAVHPQRAELWAGPITQAMRFAQVRSAQEAAAWIAQIGHESGSLRYVREIWGPTPAQRRYEGRADLGNNRPGDGKRYMGRGLIQITGRANYRRVADRLRVMGAPDFEQHPEALEIPMWAAMSAADYWLDRRLGRFCGTKGVMQAQLCRAVNGGYNGLEDRVARYAVAIKALAQWVPSA